MKKASFFSAFLKCLLLLAIVATPLAAQSKKEREAAKKLQDAGDRAFVQKNFRVAADTYGQAIAIIANNPYAHYRKGYALYELKELDAAISEFTLALSQGFRPLEVYRIRAFIYYQQKNYEAAIADIQKALVLDPRDLLFLKSLGTIYIEKNDFNSALTTFQRAAQVAPNDADIQYNMARIYFAKGDVNAQETAADTALARGTRFPGEAFYLLGDARQKKRNVAGAIDAYQKAINSKPDIYLAYRNLSEVFRSENRFEDAIRTSKDGLKVFPNDGNFYTDLSWYYSLADRHEDAVQAAKAGIQILPNQYTAYTNLCRAYNDTKNFEEAIKACNTALRLQPDDGETYFYLGNAYVQTGRTVEANRLYSKAVTGLISYTAQNPNYSDGWYLLGNASFADKQLDKAIESYQKCLAISPKFLKARTNMGIVYTQKKNKQAAMDQYNILLKADPALAAKLKAQIDRM